MWQYRKPRFELLLLEELQRQQQSSMFCDTVLQAGGISVPAHSCILSALSPQLAKTLSAAPSLHAGQNRLLKFHTIDGSTLLKLVGFFYSGELDVKGEREKEEVITAMSKLGIGGLVNLRKRGDENFGVCGKGSSDLFLQVERTKETGVQTESQNHRQDGRWSAVEGDKEDEQRTAASKAVPITARDKATQIEPGEIPHNWSDSGTQTNVSSNNGADPNVLQPTDVGSDSQPFSFPLMTLNSNDNQQSSVCVPLQHNSELGHVHPYLESCLKPSGDHISTPNEQRSVAASSGVAHVMDEGTVLLNTAYLESSKNSQTLNPTLTVSDTAPSELNIFALELDALGAGVVTVQAAVTATQAAVVPDPVTSLTSTAAECLNVTETGMGSSPVMNTAHSYSEPAVETADTTVASVSCPVSFIPISFLFLPAVEQSCPSASWVLVPVPRQAGQASEHLSTSAYIFPPPLSTCLPTSAPQVSITKPHPSSQFNLYSQETARITEKVGGALAVEGGTAILDSGVVVLENEDTVGPERFEGNVPGFINYFLNTKKESSLVTTGHRKRNRKSEKPIKRTNKREVQRKCETPRGRMATEKDENGCGVSGRPVEGTGAWKPQFGTVLQSWRRDQGGGLVGRWNTIRPRIKRGQSIKLKLKRQSRGGIWEIVKVEEKAGMGQALRGIGKVRQKGRCHPRRRALQPSLTKALLLPSWAHPPQQTPGPAPQPPDQVSLINAVNSEEPAEQIEKLLEDILMGLNFLPPNSTVAQDSNSNSTGGQPNHDANPEPEASEMQQQEEPQILQSSQGGVTPAESSARDFSDFSGTAAPSITSYYFGTCSSVLPTPCPQTPDLLPECFLGTNTEPQGCYHSSFSAMCSQPTTSSTRPSSECGAHLADKIAVPFSHCSLVSEEIQKAHLLVRSDSAESPVGFSQQARKSTWDTQGVPNNLIVDDPMDPIASSQGVDRALSTDACRIPQHTAGEVNKILEHILQSSEKLSALQSLEEGKQSNQDSLLENTVGGQGRGIPDTQELGLNINNITEARDKETAPSISEADVQDLQLQISHVREITCLLEEEQRAVNRTDIFKYTRKTSLATFNKHDETQYPLSCSIQSRYLSSKELPRWVSSFCRGLQIPSSLKNEAELQAHKGLQDPMWTCPTKMQPVSTSDSKGTAQSCKLQKLLRNREDFLTRIKTEDQQANVLTRSQSKSWTLRTRVVEVDDGKVQTVSNKRKLRVKGGLQTLMQTQEVVRKVSRKCSRNRNSRIGKDNGCRLYADRSHGPKRRKGEDETINSDFSGDSKMQVGSKSNTDKMLHDFSGDSWKMRECEVRLVDINMYVSKRAADHTEQPKSWSEDVKMCSRYTERNSRVKMEQLVKINSFTHKQIKTSYVSRHSKVSVIDRIGVQQRPTDGLRKTIQKVKRDAILTGDKTPEKMADFCGLEKGENKTRQKQLDCGGLLMRRRKRKMEDSEDVRCVRPRLELVGSPRDADPVHTTGPQTRSCSATTLQSDTCSSPQMGQQLKPNGQSPSLSAMVKCTMESMNGSVSSSSTFEQMNKLLLHNQYRRTRKKGRETEGYCKETKGQGDQEESEETCGNALWKQRSYVEQSVDRKAVEDCYKETSEAEALEEQIWECSEKGDNRRSEMGTTDENENRKINIAGGAMEERREEWERNKQQTMSPTQQTPMNISDMNRIGRLEKNVEKDGRMSEELGALPKEGHHLSSGAELSSQPPRRIVDETLEQEEEDVEVDVVECSDASPIPLVTPLLTLGDWTSSASSNETEDEDEEIDVIGEETD